MSNRKIEKLRDDPVVESGCFLLSDRNDVAMLRKLISEHEGDEDFRIYVERVGRRRTIQQNRRYHAILRRIQSHTGMPASALHSMFVEHALPPVYEMSESGRMIRVDPSTRDMSVEEFGEFMDHVEALADEWFGC